MLGGLGGPPRGPIRLVVADLGGFNAVGIDHNVGGMAIAESTTLTGCFGALLNASSAVNRTGWGGFGGWLDQEGLPTMRRGVKVVYHTVTRRLADAF